MSGTTSPSKDILSDFSNQSEESAKKNETPNIVETNTNESLHLGSDLLAEKLDYEIDEEPDELEEQEEIDESILELFDMIEKHQFHLAKAVIFCSWKGRSQNAL